MRGFDFKISYSRIVLIATVLFGIFALFKSPGDPDFGWHYKYGEYLIQHGQILRANIFSYTFADYQWANSYWISQVAIYLTHHYLGHLLAGLLFALPLSLATVYYARALAKNLSSGIILTTLVTVMLFVESSGSGVIGRPMYYSSLLLMFLCATLLHSDDSIKRIWILPPLFLIWANTHADFVLGLFILGLYVFDKFGVAGFFAGPLSPALKKLTKCFWRGEAERAGVVDVNRQEALASVPKKTLPHLFNFVQKPLPLVLIASTLLTLINPFGVHLWVTLIKESHPYQFSHINEWVPVATDNIYYFAVYCAVLGLLVSALVGARQKLPLWYMLAVGFFCIFAVRSQYFFRIAVILGAYAVLVFWTPYFVDLKSALSVNLVKKVRLGFLAFLILSTLIISAIFATEVRESTDNAYWIEKQSYPQQALDYALANGVNGNVFNYYGWGGYMIWKYPQVKTFVDGRMPSWREGDKAVFEDYIKLVDSPAKNINLMDDYKVDWVVYPTDSKFVTYLRSSDSWQEIFTDDTATVFVR